MSRETTQRPSIYEAHSTLRQNPEAGFITPGMALGLGKLAAKGMLVLSPLAVVGLSAQYYTGGHENTTAETSVVSADLKRVFDVDFKCVGGVEAKIVTEAKIAKEIGVAALSQAATSSAKVDHSYIGPLCYSGDKATSTFSQDTKRLSVALTDGKFQTFPYVDMMNPNSVSYGQDFAAGILSGFDNAFTWASSLGKDDIPGANGTTKTQNVLRDLATLRGEDVFATACIPAAWDVGLKDIVNRRMKLNAQREFTASGFDFDDKTPGQQVIPLENIDVDLPAVVSGTLPKEHQDKINYMRSVSNGKENKDGFRWNFDGPSGKAVTCTANVVIKDDKSLETAEDKAAQLDLERAALKAETGK